MNTRMRSLVLLNASPKGNQPSFSNWLCGRAAPLLGGEGLNVSQVNMRDCQRMKQTEQAFAAMAAAEGSVALDSGKDLRVVVALDVPSVEDLGDPEDPTAAQVLHEVPRRRVAAVHVDTADAEPAVARARAARGTDGYDEALEECRRHELAWYATQEIGALLDR